MHWPVLALGPGERVGIWMQGCSRCCLGCLSPHMWSREEGIAMEVNALIDELRCLSVGSVRRVTISGGEPFEQPEALESLLCGLRTNAFHDIMVYTGYHHEELAARFPHILALIDVLIDGPFEKGNETDALWKGSGNQTMVVLTEREDLKAIYAAHEAERARKRQLQIIEKNGALQIIGIPLQKDAEVIRHGLR